MAHAHIIAGDLRTIHPPPLELIGLSVLRCRTKLVDAHPS